MRCVTRTGCAPPFVVDWLAERVSWRLHKGGERRTPWLQSGAMLNSRLLLVVLWAGCRGPAPKAPDDAYDFDDSREQQQRPLAGAVVGTGRIVCVDPDAREVSGPLEQVHGGEAWQEQLPEIGDVEPSPSGGAVVEDLTGDGLVDIFLPQDTPCLFFEGRADGTLVDASSERIPLAETSCHAWGASAADADNDGDLDLFITREADTDMLWLNDGAGHFTDASAEAGLPDHRCGSRSASWADMDGDGDLDLFVGRHRVILRSDPEPCPRDDPPESWGIPLGNPNSLLENQGDGTFIDVTTERLPRQGVDAYTFVGAWLDLNGDLAQDLVLINDFGAMSTPTTAYINDGTGHFRELPAAAGLSMPIFGMSVAVGDINGDKRPDLAITDIDRLHLMVSHDHLSWVDEAASRGLWPDRDRRQLASWDTALEDMNHDGLLDAVVVFGPTEDPLAAGAAEVLEQPDALFLQGASGSFTDVAVAWGFDSEGVGRGMVVSDVDNDGWLDILRTDYRSGPAELLRQRCGEAAWVTVAFEGPSSGFGARVEIDVASTTHTRWYNPTAHHLGSSALHRLHVGLGAAEWLDEVRVFWPDGAVTVARDVATRQHLTASHPDLY